MGILKGYPVKKEHLKRLMTYLKKEEKEIESERDSKKKQL